MTADRRGRVLAPRTLLAAGGIDPRWSRTVEVPDRRSHLAPARQRGRRSTAEPVGTLLCVHGNPTWSYLWRRLVAAGAPRGRVRGG